MSREQLAADLELIAEPPSSIEDGSDRMTVLLAAAELRKACATCRYKSSSSRLITGPKEAQYVVTDHHCVQWNNWVPIDGSGFCHRWEGKP